MSIRIELHLGGQIIRTALAQKVTDDEDQKNGGGDVDRVFDYNWGIYGGAGKVESLLRGPIAQGTVQHRYGDGPEKLAALIMGDYARIKGPDHPQREESE